MIPHMILQLIVENAVNYGATDTLEINIRIDVYRNSPDIILRVSDKGSKIFDPTDITTGSGIGLKNIEGRLFALYHRKVSYENRIGGGLIVIIAIPGDVN